MLKKKLTIYDTIPMQIFFIKNIKEPLENIVLTLTLFGLNRVQRVIIAVLIAIIMIVMGKGKYLPKIAWMPQKILRSLEGIPTPTKEDTYCPNTHILIDAEREYFKHFYHEQDRARFMRAFFKFLIILYYYDLPWRLKIDWVLRFLHNQSWIEPTYPDNIKNAWRWWREDETQPFPWIYDPETIGK